MFLKNQYLRGKFDQSLGSLILPKNKGKGFCPHVLPVFFDS